MQNSNENKNSRRLIDVLSDEIPDLPIKEYIDRSKRFEDILRSTNNIDTVKVKPENSAIAQQLEELKQLRKELECSRADYAAYKASEELKARKIKRNNFLVNVISAIVGGIAVYYWPQIVLLVQRFIH